MEKLLKNKDIAEAKKFFPKFQSILMQVAKNKTINRKTAARKNFKEYQKNLKITLTPRSCLQLNYQRFTPYRFC